MTHTTSQAGDVDEPAAPAKEQFKSEKQNPYREEIPKELHLANGKVSPPNSPGVYQIDGLNGYRIPATKPAADATK